MIQYVYNSKDTMTKYTGHGLLTAFTDVGNSYAVFVEIPNLRKFSPKIEAKF